MHKYLPARGENQLESLSVRTDITKTPSPRLLSDRITTNGFTIYLKRTATRSDEPNDENVVCKR